MCFLKEVVPKNFAVKLQADHINKILVYLLLEALLYVENDGKLQGRYDKLTQIFWHLVSIE